MASQDFRRCGGGTRTRQFTPTDKYGFASPAFGQTARSLYKPGRIEHTGAPDFVIVEGRNELRRSQGRSQERHNPMADTTNAPSKVEEHGTAADAPSAENTELASKLVNRFAVWSGVAGLIPLPIIDVFAVGGLQLQMLRRISQLYGVPFSENRGKALIASLAGTLIPASSALGAASALKAVPLVGTLAGGFVMPVLSGGATYAIGKAFIEHFASGGTLLDFNPPDYREFVRAQKEMWDSRTKKAHGAETPAEHAGTAAGS
jgi:uncharacterized protein (DUF697 family)